MIEPGFGSSPSIWTGIPSPAFGWIQPGNALGMQAQTAVPADASPPNMYGPGSLGMHWGIPTLFAPEVALPALLATVAAKRGQPQGPTNDHEVEEFIYDVCELLPGLAEVDVAVKEGRRF